MVDRLTNYGARLSSDNRLSNNNSYSDELNYNLGDHFLNLDATKDSLRPREEPSVFRRPFILPNSTTQDNNPDPFGNIFEYIENLIKSIFGGLGLPPPTTPIDPPELPPPGKPHITTVEEEHTFPPVIVQENIPDSIEGPNNVNNSNKDNSTNSVKKDLESIRDQILKAIKTAKQYCIPIQTYKVLLTGINKLIEKADKLPSSVLANISLSIESESLSGQVSELFTKLSRGISDIGGNSSKEGEQLLEFNNELNGLRWVVSDENNLALMINQGEKLIGKMPNQDSIKKLVKDIAENTGTRAYELQEKSLTVFFYHLSKGKNVDLNLDGKVDFLDILFAYRHPAIFFEDSTTSLPSREHLQDLVSRYWN